MFSVFINERTNKQTKKQLKVPKAHGYSITHTHREERAPGRAEDKGNQKQRQTWVGEGRLPCAVYSEGHGEQKLLFARKGKWDSEEMGGKQKVKGGGVVMHKKRGWRAVHFSPTP